LRPSSSLDSATANFAHSSLGLRPTSGLADRLSPYTGVSDIANIINASSTSPLAPPLTTNLRAGKATTGTLLDQMTSRSPGPVLPVPGSTNLRDSNSPTPYRTLKDQLKQELRTAVEGRRAYLDNRDIYPKSEGDLHALFDIYNNVPDILLPSQFSRSHRRNVSDSALFSPIHEDLPPGYYKSHGFDSLKGRRPLSSLSRGLLGDSYLDPLYGYSSRVGLLQGLTSEYEGKTIRVRETLSFPSVMHHR
jgi:hypothetical protein